jgi:hypothetical protein
LQAGSGPDRTFIEQWVRFMYIHSKVYSARRVLNHGQAREAATSNSSFLTRGRFCAALEHALRAIAPQMVARSILLVMLVGCTNAETVLHGAPIYTVSVFQGQYQSAPAGSPVAIRPALKIVDANGDPVLGIAVVFAIKSGGGAVTGATSSTGSDGIAAVGGWTLGSTPGVNTLTANVAGGQGSPAVFYATGASASVIALEVR